MALIEEQPSANQEIHDLQTPQPTRQTERNFIIFWVGQIFSILGSWVVNFTVNWWFVTTYQDASLIALYATLTYIPLVLTTPFAGVWVDRWDKKKTILVFDSVVAFTTLGYIYALNTTFHPLWFIVVLGIINNACGAFQQPAIAAMIPLMIRKENLTRINGLRTFSGSGVRIIAPVLTGILLGIFPLHSLLWIDIITYVVAVVALLTIPLPHISRKTSENQESVGLAAKSFFKDFMAGFNIIRTNQIVRFLVVFTLITNFLHTPYQTLMTLFIQRDHGATEFDYAFINLLAQIGLLAGSFLMTLKIQWKRKVLGTVICNIGFGLAAFLTALAPTGNFWFIGMAGALHGIAMGIGVSLYYSLLQESVSHDFQGRIFAFDMAISICIMPIGMALSGPLSEAIGIKPLILIAEGLLMFFAVITLVVKSKLVSYESLPDS